MLVKVGSIYKRDEGIHMNYRKDIFLANYHFIGHDELFATPHHDDSIEMLQFWSDGGYFMVGNHILPIKAGGTLIIDAMETHYSNPADPDTYNRSKLIISRRFFESICDACGLDFITDDGFFKNGASFYQHNSSGNTVMAIDHCYKLAAEHYQDINSPFAQAHIVSSLISILTIILLQIQDTGTLQATHTIDMLANYVNESGNNWEALSMEQICSNLHISPSRASHLFKELTGKTLTQYIMLLRMAESKRLLLNSSLKIKEISTILKFDDPTTFCRYFKKNVGCTPKEYRDSKGISISLHSH